MVLVFALAAAVLYGSADFLGGTAARQARALSVLVVSAPSGAVVLLAAALLAGGPFRQAGLGWAMAAGVAGTAGVGVFYAGLAAGPMSVVSPVSALVSTVLPVGVALAAGERPSPAVYAGAGVCVLAILLVSMEGGGAAGRSPRPRVGRGLAYGVVSGAAFGLFFVLLRNAGAAGVLWPVAISRVAGAAVLLAAVAGLGARLVTGSNAGRRALASWSGVAGGALATAVASGVIDATANVCYVLATRAGLFGLAVVITSLYPGMTVLLARVVHGERMRAVQRAGLLLAALGIALVAL